MRRHYAVVSIALLLLLGIGALAAAASTHHADTGRCFPAAKWGPAADGLRPCVKVTRIYEDGSFGFRVSDANGTTRYTSGVGALDR